MGRTHFTDIAIKADQWEDLRFPAQSINPPGAVGDPDVDPNNGTLLFDASSVEQIGGIAQIPHSWRIDSDIELHIHWAKTTTGDGDVVWNFSYSWGNDTDVIAPTPTNWITATIVAGPTGAGAAERHIISSWGDLDGTDKHVSSILLWRIQRVATSSDDTYAGDARLYEFDVHYMLDTFGSDQQYSKTNAQEWS